VHKTDFGDLLRPHYEASFLTCPAPNAREARKRGVPAAEIRAALERRIDAVLTVAGVHGERSLVLGAFGCGVFGNDVDTVARCFATVRVPHGQEF